MSPEDATRLFFKLSFRFNVPVFGALSLITFILSKFSPDQSGIVLRVLLDPVPLVNCLWFYIAFYLYYKKVLKDAIEGSWERMAVWVLVNTIFVFLGFGLVVIVYAANGGTF